VKKDSTGICFIGERKFRDFLERYLPAQPGDIVTLDGRVLGRHNGLMYYTIGQRQGLGIGGTEDGSEDPWYVADKQLDRNRLVVVQGLEHPALFHSHCRISQLHWISQQIDTLPFECSAKIRYRQRDSACCLRSVENGAATVEFAQPQRAITPGQALVFYAGEQCLGGGVIDAAFDS
jgi:tRNA-specific 2-thiouridylase